MYPITINGTPLAIQPTDVNENPVQIRTQNEAIDGSLSVNSFNTKRQVIMSWTYLDAATFQFIKALGDGIASVVYSNTASNVAGGTNTFTGILSYEQDSFVQGGSALVPLKVTIREV